MPSIRLFRVAGVTIRLDAGWALVLAFLAWSLASGRFPPVLPGISAASYWAGGLVAVLLLFASIALHEFAHTAVRYAYGSRAAAVTLHVFGGASDADAGAPHPLADALDALAGPSVSFAVAAVALVTRHATAQAEWAAALLGYFALVNVAIGLFNLVPGLPLDGGRLLRALLWWWSGNADGATAVATRVGTLFGVALVGLGAARLFARDVVAGVWFVALGVVLFLAGRSSEQRAGGARREDAEPALDRVA